MEQAQDSGRLQRRPWRMGFSAWWQVSKRVFWRWLQEQAPTMAAGLAFRALMTIFPILLASVAIVGLVAEPGQLVAWLEPLLKPLPGQARSVIETNAQRIADLPVASLTTGLVVALLVGLWSLGNGILALMGMYNTIYRQQETRPFYAVRGIATLLGVILVVAAFLVAVVMIVLPQIFDLLQLSWLLVPLNVGRYLAIILLLLAIQASLGRFAVNRRAPRWEWLTPGAVIGVILWALASALFDWYLESHARVDRVYGALAGFVILALWLQLSISALLVGAFYNAELEYQTDADSTVGPDRPKGHRGAFVADHSIHEAGRDEAG